MNKSFDSKKNGTVLLLVIYVLDFILKENVEQWSTKKYIILYQAHLVSELVLSICRGKLPQGMNLMALRFVHTSVRTLQIYSDRETTDSVLHLFVLKSSER